MWREGRGRRRGREREWSACTWVGRGDKQVGNAWCGSADTSMKGRCRCWTLGERERKNGCGGGGAGKGAARSWRLHPSAACGIGIVVSP
ncbi:hypothetical protein B0H12DRAFT_1168804 [Mycena haematopus]|nr:hypothetical protein B0H12DRAFT_1168804 [Mycena haematopus]